VSLEKFADAFASVIEVGIHTLLFLRQVYPAHLFATKRKYNVAVQQSRHPALNAYISNVVTCIRQHVLRGDIEALLICIHTLPSAAAGNTNNTDADMMMTDDSGDGVVVLERYVWQLKESPGLREARQQLGAQASRLVHSEWNEERMEQELRALLLRLTVCTSAIPELSSSAVDPDRLSWSLAIKTRSEPDSAAPRQAVSMQQAADAFPASHMHATRLFQAENERQWVEADSFLLDKDPSRLLFPIRSSDNGLISWSLHVECRQR